VRASQRRPGFDLGNHFCECYIDNQAPTWPGFVVGTWCITSRAVRARVRSSLSAWSDLARYPGADLVRTFLQAYDPALADSPAVERELQTGILASHLHWTVWALLKVSSDAARPAREADRDVGACAGALGVVRLHGGEPSRIGEPRVHFTPLSRAQYAHARFAEYKRLKRLWARADSRPVPE
jgi:hypothetical protein